MSHKNELYVVDTENPLARALRSPMNIMLHLDLESRGCYKPFPSRQSLTYKGSIKIPDCDRRVSSLDIGVPNGCP